MNERLNNLINSAGFISAFQFIMQLKEFMKDGYLDNSEIQQLFLSATSVVQSLVVMSIVVYMKFMKKA